MATKLHNITFSSIIFAVSTRCSEGEPELDTMNINVVNHAKRNVHVDGVIYKMIQCMKNHLLIGLF